MSDDLSPLWNTYLTNEVQLKLFLENYLCGSGCAPVFTFSRSGSAVNLHTLSSASEYIGAAFCMNSEVSPPDQAWPFERTSRGNILYFFFFLPSSPWLEPAAACVLWLVLTLVRLFSVWKQKTVSSFSPSGTETWERNSLCCSASTTQKQAELI